MGYLPYTPGGIPGWDTLHVHREAYLGGIYAIYTGKHTRVVYTAMYTGRHTRVVYRAMYTGRHTHSVVYPGKRLSGASQRWLFPS